MKIKLIDENLIGQPGLSRYIDPQTNWERETDDYDVAIHVDGMCFKQPVAENKTSCAWLIEPPIINGENYINIIKNKDNFKYIFTHHMNLCSQSDNVVFIPHGGTWLRDGEISIHEKNKLVSCIFSWKNWNPYHRMRFRVYDRLKDDSRVEFFGSGCEKPIDYKIDALKDFKFSIVIENSVESDYFTEKLLDCFLTGTIPIYVGTKKVSEYFNPDGIIYFEGDEDLPNILDTLSSELYESKMDAIKENFEIAKNYIHPEQLIENFLNANI